MKPKYTKTGQLTKASRQAFNEQRVILGLMTTVNAIEALNVKTQKFKYLGEVNLKTAHADKIATITETAADLMDEALPVLGEYADRLDVASNFIADMATIVSVFTPQQLIQFKQYINNGLAQYAGLKIS